jgi:hypothetical protein
VCPSFLSLLSHLLSLTHSLSYIVSSLVRTRVSWKCLDFDTSHKVQKSYLLVITTYSVSNW